MLTEYDSKRLPPLVIKQNGKAFSGIFELSTDEQLAKKIYETTGDKIFKGFLPLSWNTAIITKMRDAYDQLKSSGTLTALNMSYKIPEVNISSHQYFITNLDKIKGWVDQPSDILKPIQPLLWIAGIGLAAYILFQLAPIIKRIAAPKRKE